MQNSYKFHHYICDESYLNDVLSSFHSSKEKNNKNSAQILGNEVKTEKHASWKFDCEDSVWNILSSVFEQSHLAICKCKYS